MLFIGSCNGMFRALDRKTGRVVWETQVGPSSGPPPLARGPASFGVASQYFFHGDPLITPDVVVVGADATSGGNIHAFDRVTGKERWRFPAGRGVLGAIAGLGRRAYASFEGQVVSLDIDSGERRWSVPLKVSGWEGPATAGNRVFAGTVERSLHALNADTGREEWRVALAAPVTTTVSASETALYVGTEDGSVHRVDPRNGAILGSRKVDEKLRPRGVPVLTSDSVLVLLADEGADHRALVSLDPRLEKVRWRQTASPLWSTSRVFVWGDLAVVGAPAGQAVAYCAADGSMVWSRPVTGTVRAIGGSADTLYVGARQGSLYALQPPRACDGK